MEENIVRHLISKGEGENIEFKEAKESIPKSTYNTVCAFLNTSGGTLLFGVNDKGEIVGVNPDCVSKMKKNFSDTVKQLNPPVCLELKEVNINGKIVLFVELEQAPEVHRLNNKVFIRVHESDQDITNSNEELQRLFLRKSEKFTENEIIEYTKKGDIRSDLIRKAKNIISSDIWKEIKNETHFLKKMGLYLEDRRTGRKGYTLACLLIFGTDEAIASVIPHFKVDLIKRVDNSERYDDRVTLQTNLLDCYYKSMEFVQKHLSDPFYLDGQKRESLRDIIFRELIVNMLIHKEYSFKEPTRLIIEKGRILIENSNNPRFNGCVAPSELSAYAKNPNIAKFFRSIGLAEELGSGVTVLQKYCKKYAGHEPIVKDEHIFSVEIPIDFFKE